jgi:hypothetical protein
MSSKLFVIVVVLFAVALSLFAAVAPKNVGSVDFAPAAEGLKVASVKFGTEISNAGNTAASNTQSALNDIVKALGVVGIIVGGFVCALIVWAALATIGKKGVLVLAVIGIIAFMTVGCTPSKPQPICRTDAPKGQTWTALIDSVSANNPRGICQLKDATGKVIGQQAGEKSFAEYFAQAKQAVEETAQCYNDKGQGTTCIAEQIKQ